MWGPLGPTASVPSPLSLSLLGFTKAWFEAGISASQRGYLEKGFLSGMGAYLQNQLQMGAGLPMNAIEKGEITTLRKANVAIAELKTRSSLTRFRLSLCGARYLQEKSRTGISKVLADKVEHFTADMQKF